MNEQLNSTENLSCLFIMSTFTGWRIVGKRLGEEIGLDASRQSDRFVPYTSPRAFRRLVRHTGYRDKVPWHIPLFDPNTTNRWNMRGLRALASQYDAVIAGHLWQATGMLGNRANVPVIAYIDATDHLFRTEFGDQTITDHALEIERNTLHKVSHIFAMSRWAADDIREFYGVDEGRITVLPPPCQRPLDTPDKSYASGPLNLVFVGSDFERKGGRRLLDWQRQYLHPLFQLHIVTDEAYVDRTVPNTVWHGALDNDKVTRELFASMDVLCHPTMRDTSAIVVVEAAMAGIPAVAAATGGIPDLIEHGVTGYLLPAPDDDGFVNALRRLGENPGLARQLGNAAKRKAEAEFSPTVIYRRMLDDVSRVVADRRRAAEAGTVGN